MVLPPADALVRLVERAIQRQVRSLTLLGRGGDHTAYDIDGAFVARLPHVRDDGTAAAIDREVRILEVAGAVSPVPVPEVVAVDGDAGLLVLRKLPGASLLDVPSPAPTRVADQLGLLLAALHRVPPDALAGTGEPDRYPLASYLADATESMPTLAPLVTTDQRDVVEAFLATAPPPEPTELVFSHNDLGAEHLLADADRETLTGVIDWSDAAIADPALDVGRIFRDLGPGPAELVLAALGHGAADGVMERAVFHARVALLEDLAYGLRTGDRRYTDAALDNLGRTFCHR